MPENAGNKIKVLLVDDSAVVRSIIKKILSAESNIEIVGDARNGKIGVEVVADFAKKNSPVDMVILDVEMPEMDGITAIPLILKASPKTKIIMASTLTQKNAQISIKALALGASDYVPKPTTQADFSAGNNDFAKDLVTKIYAISGKTFPAETTENKANPKAEENKNTVAKNLSGIIKPPAEIKLRPAPKKIFKVLAIGSSTGGPQALIKFFNGLKVRLPDVPIFLTQHMPPVFTTYLAKQIEDTCGIPCSEAKDGELVQNKKIYLAPGDFHMLIRQEEKGVVLKIVKDPPENFCRPAVDPMLRSITETYKGAVLAVILTGMGDDGMRSCKNLVEKGGVIIAQDKETSVVWGMPGAVAENGLCSHVLPLDKISTQVISMF